jgi:hypothetical protein
MIAPSQAVQIVSRFHPQSCGVGDYARLLAAEWQRKHDIQSRFLVADELWPNTRQPEGWEARRLRRSSREDWADLLGSQPAGVILQYSGYGYARRGAPLWLVRTLRSLRSRLPQVPVIIMFHEIAASGPMTTSSFWFRPVQLYVARRLSTLSDMVMTNCEANARLLESMRGMKNRQLVIQPVISNFGESGKSGPWSQRVRRILVFNSNFGGQAPAASFWQDLTAAVSRVKASGVTMIGRPVNVPPDLSFSLAQPGFLTVGEVSGILAESAFGYVFHGPLLLGKSGVFAAFAAHGVVPLIQTVSEVLPDGLIEGKTYHALQRKLPSQDDTAYFEQIGRNVREWYQPHDLAATAQVYADLLKHHQPAGASP